MFICTNIISLYTSENFASFSRLESKKAIILEAEKKNKKIIKIIQECIIQG